MRGPRPPLIGVTTSEMRPAAAAKPLEEADPARVEMALGMVYMRAVELAGGLPVVLPPLSPPCVGPLVEQLAGVCLSGGPDLAPAGYGASPSPNLGPTEPRLDAFETSVVNHADRLGVPVLGICRGLQALNVARGGTLYQHLPDVTDGSIAHRQIEPGHRSTHHVRLASGARVARVLGATELDVNSFHHQGIETLGAGLTAVGWAPDGVVEAIEENGERLVLGVQWHAEGLVDRPEHLALFEALVAAAAATSRTLRAA
jgi:putative glutamine amidotransferase